MDLVFFKWGDINPLDGGVVPIEQVPIEQAGVCGRQATTTEGSFFHLEEYYERICLKNQGRYVA